MPKEPHWSEDISRMWDHIDLVRKARWPQVMENKTYQQLQINRPGQILDGAGAKIVMDARGLRELGLSLMHQASRAARAQICKLLSAAVTPVGGTYARLEACDNMTAWLNGLLTAIEFPFIAEQLTLESMAVVESHAIIESDPVTASFRSVMLDPNESFYSVDRQEFTTTREMSRRWVMAAVARKNKGLAAAIAELPQWSYETVVGVDIEGMFATDDTIEWREAFLAPIGDPKAGGLPGRHVVQLSRDITLVDEPWNGPIPIVSSNWETGARGRSDGKAMGRTVAPFHAWANELNLKLHESLKGAVAWVVGPEGTKMPSDAQFQFIPNDGPEGAIKVYVPDPVSDRVVTQIDRVEASCLRTAGISEEAASGTPPQQLTSGRALSKWEGLVNQFLSPQHSTYKGLYMQAGRILAYLGPKLYKGKPVNVRRSPGTSVIQQIDWSQIDLPEDSYAIDFDAVSALGDSIPQRIQNTEVLKELALIDAVEMLEHVDVPDFRAKAQRLTGPRKFIDYQINEALSHAKVVPPMEMQDPQAGLKSTSEALQAALASYVRPSKESLEALRVLYRLFRKAAKAAAPPPVPLPAAPPAGAPIPGAP
jgi:hypothetical protein